MNMKKTYIIPITEIYKVNVKSVMQSASALQETSGGNEIEQSYFNETTSTSGNLSRENLTPRNLWED